MKRKPKISNDPAGLRRRAEVQLRARPRKKKPESGELRSPANALRLLHELEVHQVELELQNTELQAARDRTEALLEKYTDLYDFAPVGYLTLDREGIVCEANLAAASLLGIERSHLVNRRFGFFMDMQTRPTFTTFLGKAFACGTRTVCETLLQPEGHPPRWTWIEAGVVAQGQQCRLAIMDISDRKQAESERARLEREIQAASEREQRRIGERLHEDLCQRLAGIQAIATSMAAALKTKALPQSDVAGEIAGEVSECLHQALHFANTLQPVWLLGQGLVAAINHLVLRVQKSSGTRCDFTSENLPEIAIADATHLYRITQEALDNAVQHANASLIDVVLLRSERGIKLIIADNGSGLAAQSEQGSGMGLQIMRYRSDLLAAALTIASPPGGGTVVTCCYPIAGREQRSASSHQRSVTRRGKNDLRPSPKQVAP